LRFKAATRKAWLLVINAITKTTFDAHGGLRALPRPDDCEKMKHAAPFAITAY